MFHNLTPATISLHFPGGVNHGVVFASPLVFKAPPAEINPAEINDIKSSSVYRHLTLGPWSAFREWFPGNAGYGKLRIVNSTHVHWEQIKAYDGSVTDSVWIQQQHHGPFKPLDVEY